MSRCRPKAIANIPDAEAEFGGDFDGAGSVPAALVNVLADNGGDARRMGNVDTQSRQLGHERAHNLDAADIGDELHVRGEVLIGDEIGKRHRAEF